MAADDNSAVFNQFLTKLGTVLSLTKDTLLKDFLGNLPDYVPHLALSAPPDDYEQFKKDVSEMENQIGRLVECIFNRLGYDISHFSEASELYGLITAILNATDSLGTAIKDLSGEEFSWQQEVVRMMKEAQSDGKVTGDYDVDVQDGTTIPVGKNASIVIGDISSGRLKAILDIIEDLISLIKRFRDVEWDKICDQTSDFGIFIQGTYLKKDFAERLFDHVLTVLLKNAKEVFDEELDLFADQVDSYRKQIRDILQDAADEVLSQIDSVKAEIKALEDQIRKAAKKAAGEVKDAIGDCYEYVSGEIREQYRLLKNRLHRLMKEALGDFGRLGDILDRIYHVLDFFGLLDTATIEVARFIPNQVELPEVDLGKVDALLAMAYQKDLDEGRGDANGALNEALADIRQSCPVIEIYVLKWSRVQQIFADPSAYFNEQFPLKDFDDAEVLLGRIYDLAKSFDADIPDFGTITSIVDNLYARVREALKEARGEVQSKLWQFGEFLLDIKRVLENYAIEFKKKLETAYAEYSSEAESVFNQLRDRVMDVVNGFRDGMTNEIRSFRLPDTNIKFKSFIGYLDGNLNGYMKRQFVEPFIQVVTEKAKEYDIFREIDPEMWKAEILATVGEGGKALAKVNLSAEYKAILAEIEPRIKAVFDKEAWKKKFGNMVAELKAEFEKQTAKVPSSEEALKQFGKEQMINLLSGKSIDNPFSDFDFGAYLDLVGNAVKKMVPTDLDVYYLKFRKATENAVTALMGLGNGAVSTLKSKVEKAADDTVTYAETVQAFARDVFVSYWSSLKDTVYKVLIRPFLTLVEKTVKEWIRTVLVPEVVRIVKENILDQIDLSAYYDLFDEVKEGLRNAQSIYKEVREDVSTAVQGAGQAIGDAAGEVLDVAHDMQAMVQDVLLLVEDARNITSWQDGLAFAIRLYRLIPQQVKDAIDDLVDLPELDFGDIHLPDYSLDVEHKFFATTLYQYEKNVSIQLVAFAADRATGETDEDGFPLVKSGVYILPVVKGRYGAEFALGESHHLTLNASVSLNKQVDSVSPASEEMKKALESGLLGMFLSRQKDSYVPEITWLASTDAVQAWLELIFSRNKGDILDIYRSDTLEITMEDYPQKVFVGYDKGFDAGWLGRVENLSFRLHMENLNDFFANLFSKPVEFSLELLELGYSYKGGLTFNGKGHVRIPINKTIDLKAVKFDNLALEVGTKDFRNLQLAVSTNFTADLSGVSFSFSDFGLGFDLNLLSPDYRFGDFDMSPTVRFPDGIGIGLDIGGTVKGAGLLKWDREKGEILGAVELSVMDLFSASALILLNMKMPDGSKGFSFMGALCVYFTPGIQLGMGFSLTAIGGSLGLNRSIDVDKMRDAVRDGSLSSVVFVKDLQKNLSTVMANITSFYPVSRDAFFFGALAQITWGEILQIECGLFIELPNLKVILLGGIHLKVADKAEKLVALNAYFMGSFEAERGISFDAELVDTHIVGIHMYGSVALRIFWGGDTKGFLISAGGFHPQYKPEAGFHVSNMKRIGMKLDYSILKLSMENYFAVTSNTVQFGSDTRLQIGWDKFGIVGKMYFNVLFQFNPFQFTFDAGIGVAVKCGSWKLLSVDLYLEVSGPAPWHVQGKASFWFLFIKIKVSFSKTWGKKQSISDKKYIDILPLYMEAFGQDANWKVVKTDIVDNLVILSTEGLTGLVMHPSDAISFSQDVIPMKTALEKYGEALPGDIRKLTLREVQLGGQALTDKDILEQKSSFAPSQTRRMTDQEKIVSPSYEKMPSGFAFKDADVLRTGGVVEGDGIEVDVDCQIGDRAAWDKYYYNRRLQIPGLSSLISGLSSLKEVHVDDEGQPLAQGFSDAPSTNPEPVRKRDASKPSSRRTEAGFHRYVRQLEKTTARNLGELIESLDKPVGK